MPLELVVSFDIDGTMVFGDPPGPISVETVRDVQTRGAVIGSASDRTISNQSELWRRYGISVDFVGHKHQLDQIRAAFPAKRCIHVGDTYTDEQYARWHSFEFYFADQLPAVGASSWFL